MSIFVLTMLSGCSTFPGWISASGPSGEQVLETPTTTAGRIPLVEVDAPLARQLALASKGEQFADVFLSAGSNNYLIGPGDIIVISVWEAPPAMLFGTANFAPDVGPTGAQINTFPAQMVTSDGTITVPFAGRVPVKGRTTSEIEANIVKLLQGKANQPQVMVSVVKNNTSNVTVVGEVNSSVVMPLTPKGEHLLDALAAGGGVKQDVSHVAIQLSRDDLTAMMPLDAIIRDPRQNVLLKPGDVVTALFQPQTFSVFGAAGKTGEVPFEAQGISLAQALARSGGLNDTRADARGVFVFRFQDKVPFDLRQPVAPSANGTVPVIYQVNLRDPAAFFVTQDFPIENHDVIYIANSPSAEIQKFINLLLSPVASPALSITNAVRD